MGLPEANLLVISDLHLGEGIGTPVPRDPATLDRELRAFLEHYTVVRRDNRPWRLVINGDMVDFIGVSIKGDAASPADYRTYGLGARARDAAAKMAAVIERHDGVFQALGRFVGAGNEVSVVLGNHDAEFHFPEVQILFRDAVARGLNEHGIERDVSVAWMENAVQFCPWFFFEEGVAWIEHGHQYDPYCSFEDVLEPASDAAEIDPNVGSVLVRYVLSQVDKDIGDQYDDGFWGHLRFAASRGVSGGIAVVTGYADMNRRLFRFWWDRSPVVLKARMERSKARFDVIARKARIAEERLATVRDMWMRPVGQDFGRLLRAVMLDRLMVLLATPLLLLAPLMTPWEWLPLVGLVVGGTFGVALRAAMRERETPDPRAAMRRVSATLREHLRVPFVVFGHSHDAAAELAETGAYFNTGTWVAHGPKRAFTHVLIERGVDGVRARLLQWRDGDSRELGA